jgi:hypothetical protein
LYSHAQWGGNTHLQLISAESFDSGGGGIRP